MGIILNENPGANRIYGLDILRASAIFFVVFGHGNMILGHIIPPRLLDLFVVDGVSLFFVLSGFLIGSILIRTLEQQGLSWPVLLNFWIRRWFRTLPNYYLILFVLTVLHLIFTNFDYHLALKYAFFIQNFNSIHPAFFAEAWSLSIEEWFYVLMPLTLFGIIALKGNARQALLWLVIAYIVFSTSVRFYRFFTLEIEKSYMVWDTVFRKQVITRLDSLMMGVLGGYISIYYQKVWVTNKKWLFYAGLFLLLIHRLSFYFRDLLTNNFNAYYCIFSFTLISVGTLCLLPYLSNWKHGKGFLCKLITSISIISYSMYLIHHSLIYYFIMPIILNFIPFVGADTALVNYAAYWGYTILGSVFLYKYFEAPLLSQREKYTRKILAGGTAIRQQTAFIRQKNQL